MNCFPWVSELQALTALKNKSELGDMRTFGRQFPTHFRSPSSPQPPPPTLTHSFPKKGKELIILWLVVGFLFFGFFCIFINHHMLIGTNTLNWFNKWLTVLTVSKTTTTTKPASIFSPWSINASPQLFVLYFILWYNKQRKAENVSVVPFIILHHSLTSSVPPSVTSGLWPWQSTRPGSPALQH